jgi:hypothetical protein
MTLGQCAHGFYGWWVEADELAGGPAMLILFYISGHGFGHASRSIELIR